MPLDDSSSPGLDSVLKQVGDLSEKMGKDTAPERAEMKALEDKGKQAITALETETNRKMPDPPKMGALPQAPNTQIPPAMEAIGHPLTVLSIFASLLTKAPLKTALSAAGSAMENYHKGNVEAAKQSLAQYKEAVDTAFKQHNSEMEDYHTLMEEHGNTIKGKAAVLEAIGAAHGWQEVSRLAKAGQVDQALKIVQMNQTNMQRVKHEEFLEKMFDDGKTTEQQTFNQWKKEHPDASAEEAAKFRSTLQKQGTSPQSVAMQKFIEENPDADANAIAGFVQKMRPPRSAPAMALQKFMEENPQADADAVARFGQDYAARNKAVSAFATGKEGGIIRSFNTATEHLDTLQKLGDALGNKDMKAFNSVSNAWADHFGGVAPNNFNSAKQIVGDEIVKAIVGAGGGVGDREKAQAVLDAAKTPEQLKGAISTLKELIGGQLKGLEKQYEDTTGRNDFRSRLTGAAKVAVGGEGKKRYAKGDVIDTPHGKMRVTGGDPDDPDVEPVK